jgi:hypothetical protein
MRFTRSLRVVVMLAPMALVAALAAQTPAPFPKPAQPGQNPPPRTPPAPPPQTVKAQPTAGEPSEATLGVPIYPSAQFIASYNAGQGQRYYLFGSETDFLQVVTYYRNILKQKGELVFEEPPIHMFETGRFREETMAFPPSVTVKDYTWGDSKGYLNPKRGGKPERFKTIVQIVPAAPGTPK